MTTKTRPTHRAPVDRSSIAPAVPQVTQIPVVQVRIDGGTQMRAALDSQTVADYADLIRFDVGARWPFPPVEVFYDGQTYWLADGFHRVNALLKLYRIYNNPDATGILVPAIVHAGDRRDAILHAAKANAAHGLRRTNADKRRSVETLLRDEEWSTWSDNKIAEACKVSQPFVSNLRASLITVISEESIRASPQDMPVERTYTTRHGTEAKMKTARIGKHAPRSRRTEGSEGKLQPASELPPPPAPPTMPDELTALGWRLIQTRMGKYYGYNSVDNRSTALAMEVQTVIDDLYERQRNVTPPFGKLRGDPMQHDIDQRRNYHLQKAIEHLRRMMEVSPEDGPALLYHIERLEAMLP